MASVGRSLLQKLVLEQRALQAALSGNLVQQVAGWPALHSQQQQFSSSSTSSSVRVALLLLLLLLMVRQGHQQQQCLTRSDYLAGSNATSDSRSNST
jgi:hypothetical protein